ncbi:hypothetical protein SAMN04515674_104251 [Pseudarcicella hirudinis]|uniref:Uncharacterized protein n=1 Tax=Pseudarcicella hirudinis TaxID=1079859 RepID=A0A1I5RW20_9BACT|nr:hypothetical protein [Pseudarcicella hirudinis]SFP62156.1 hypothetical protein SAMN04515674_104251 [Pseudarcicella hirudinis]
MKQLPELTETIISIDQAIMLLEKADGILINDMPAYYRVSADNETFFGSLCFKGSRGHIGEILGTAYFYKRYNESVKQSGADLFFLTSGDLPVKVTLLTKLVPGY